MNLKSLLILFVFLALSCEDETLTSTKAINEMTDPDAVLQYSGAFTSGPYGTVTGTAQIFKRIDDTFDLKLEMFNTSNGPDLYVYLSKEAMPINFISLGKLKSTNGSQVYAITGSPDFNEYKYISIHCKAYNHLFGFALLTEE
ncbi:MAG: DM13 domain-containing protein [Cyclobacteriaceae bacterium]|nr:DM13 domain-containing protein [Cyclobacteriaceae bacterium]